MSEPITRTILERFDVPDSRYETVVMLVEMAPQVIRGCTPTRASMPRICWKAALRCSNAGSRTDRSVPVKAGTFRPVRCTR